MEACGGSHYWGREIITLGHVCKLIPPIYVKPFLKRQKNDANDSEAIVEAAQRPTMRFVAVKTRKRRRVRCCFVPVISWCASARKRSTQFGVSSRSSA